MGKIIGMLEQLGRGLGKAFGATGPTDWWTVWYRQGMFDAWAMVGWLAYHGPGYRPLMADYNCTYLRLIRPPDVGRSTGTKWCSKELYEALLPTRVVPASFGAAKWWWVYGAPEGGGGWSFDGWLWTNPGVVASVRGLHPMYQDIGPAAQGPARLFIGG